MSLLRRWFDGLGVRIAAVLLAALLIEFIGSELLLRRIEERTQQRAQVEWLVGQLAIADRLLAALPPEERAATARRLWRKPLSIDWQPAGSPIPLQAGEPIAVDTADMGEVGPELAARDLRIIRLSGKTVAGSIALADGSRLDFRSDGYPGRHQAFYGHLTAIFLLVACIAIIALLLVRMIGQPLRRLAEAADRAGGEEAAPVMVEGPREVRRVAAAVNAMQMRLFELVRDRTQSLAAVSHDLRTPIARLKLRSATIRPVHARRAIEHDLAEMERFIASILDYLRGSDPEPERLVDIASLILTIVEDAHDGGGEISYLGPQRLEIRTRPFKLQRAVSNLVQNALCHAGQARVSLALVDDVVSITVDDDGPGIAAEELDAVFEPFRRLDVSRNHGTGGAGLGLAIVKRSIRRLGGTITLANRPEGGLRAGIRLPLGL